MLSYVIQGIGLGFAAAIQPGPFQTYVISQTLKRGWRATLPAALAPLISDGPIIAMMLLVLSQMPPWLQQALNIVSGLFILYLAWSAYQSWRDFVPTTVDASGSSQSVLRAALMNLLSPGPYIYWSLIAGPILVAGWQQAPRNGLGFLAGFYVTIVSGIAGTILLFGLARQLGPQVHRLLLGFSAIALTGFGLYQLAQGIFW